jgi:hypothetical protein
MSRDLAIFKGCKEVRCNGKAMTAMRHTTRRLEMTALVAPDARLISEGEIEKRAAVWAEK